MRNRILLFAFIVGCDTPGTFGSALFSTDDNPSDSTAEMIAQLEAEPSAKEPPERVLAQIPVLPTNTWIQVFDRSARINHRILDDGTYTVQIGEGAPQEMPVISQAQPMNRALSEEARNRIVEALSAVRFHAQAAHIPEPALDDGTALLLQPRPLAVTVRDPETGRVHTVEITADASVPASFGPLAPLWRVLDAEVFGHWLQAAVAASTP